LLAACCWHDTVQSYSMLCPQDQCSSLQPHVPPACSSNLAQLMLWSTDPSAAPRALSAHTAAAYAWLLYSLRHNCYVFCNLQAFGWRSTFLAVLVIAGNPHAAQRSSLMRPSHKTHNRVCQSSCGISCTQSSRTYPVMFHMLFCQTPQPRQLLHAG
jgi:hypothetical protein